MSIFSSIGKSISNAVSNIGGGLVNSALSFGTDMLKNEFISKANAKDAYEREKNMYQKRYQWTMNDMRAAGLNPILAASSGFQVGSAPAVQPAQYPGGEGFGYAQSSAAGAQKASKEMEVMNYEIKKKKQEVEESMSRIVKMRAERNLIGAQEKEVLKNVSLISAKIENAYQQWNVLREQEMTTAAEGNKAREQIQVIRAEAANLKAQLAQLKAIENIYSQPVGKYVQFLNEVLKAIGPTAVGLGLIMK